jgi:O-antigen/teichoic acid export membrane protein
MLVVSLAGSVLYARATRAVLAFSAAEAVSSSPADPLPLQGTIELVPRVNRPARFGRLGRNTLVYGLGGILGRVVSVVMLPVYTRYLSPTQYGVLQLLDMAGDITAILFTAGIRSGLQRFYFKAATQDQRDEVVFTTFFLEMVLSVAGTIALIASANIVNRVLLTGAGTPDLVRLAALNFTLATMTAVPLALLMIEQRATLNTVIVLAKLTIQVSLNIYFLAYRHLGVASLLLSTAIANAVMGLALVAWMLVRTGLRLSRTMVRDLRRFGVPYQIAAASAFILTFADRFFLAHDRGTAEVGLYGLAYQFGFLLYSVSSGPFLTAWEPQRYQLVSHSREERDASYARDFLYFNFVLVTAALGIVLFARPVLAVLTSRPYHSAASIVPIIVACYVVQSWGDVVRFGINVAERTKLIAWASWIATAVVLLAYAVLIPPFGGVGAAWATFIAFLVRFGLMLRWSQQVWPVTYRWSRPLLLTTIAVAVYGLEILSPLTRVSGQIAVGLGLTLLYAAMAWRFVLDDSHREGLRVVLRERKLSAMFGRS